MSVYGAVFLPEQSLQYLDSWFDLNAAKEKADAESGFSNKNEAVFEDEYDEYDEEDQDDWN